MAGPLQTFAELCQQAGLILLLLFQHWPVFSDVKELLTLVPPLVGLKGNLEMTLASRLSTAVSGSWMPQGTGCPFVSPSQRLVGGDWSLHTQVLLGFGVSLALPVSPYCFLDCLFYFLWLP